MVGEVGRSWGAGLRVALSVLVLICLCDGALNGAGEEAPWAEAARVHRSLRQPSSGTMHNMEGDKHAAALRILGGQHEQGYPWAVLIDKIGGGAITCTGSIIAKKWVVTAAHCVLNNQDNGYKSASWGTTIKFNCFYLLDGACRSMSVLRHVPHPCYFPSYDQDHDDIVLFELESEIADIPPILVDGIDGTPPWKVGSDVTLAGFGVVDNANFHRSTWLMAVDVPLATQSECARTNPSALNHKYINFSHVICTGGHAGKDSCAGDSGGPAVFKHDSKNWLVGVLSIGSELPLYSINCGIEGRYGVYTQVRQYSAWIKHIMDGGDNTCASCPCVGVHYKDPSASSAPSPGTATIGTSSGGDTISAAARVGGTGVGGGVLGALAAGVVVALLSIAAR